MRSILPTLFGRWQQQCSLWLSVKTVSTGCENRQLLRAPLQVNYKYCQYCNAQLQLYLHANWHTHTHIHLTAIFPGLPRWAGTRKAEPIWILLKQETVSGSGISWARCKSAPSSRQITTPASHHSRKLHPFNYTRLTALCPGLPRRAGTRKVKPVWILLKQETVSGRQWYQLGNMQVCTSLQPDALSAAQPTASKHWRQFS